MGNIGTAEIFLILLVTLLVFGAKRIPEIARGLGQGIREFRSATREVTRELQFDDYNRAPRAQAQPAYAPRPVPVEPATTMPSTASADPAGTATDAASYPAD